MRRLNRFQNWVLWAARIKPFDVNRALQDMLHTGMEIQRKRDEPYMKNCLMCRLYQADQRRKIGTYEPPSPTTYGKLAAQQAPSPERREPGLATAPAWFKRRNPDLIQTQHALPNAPRMTRKLTLEPYSELPPDDWLNDQKIS